MGIEYAIKSFRRNYPYTSGCIVWQLNEMYPSLFLTSLVDYYGIEKPAYYKVKQSYAKVAPSMVYDKIMYQKSQEFYVDFYITTETDVDYKAVITEDYNGDINKVEYKGSAKEGNLKLCNKTYALHDGYLHILFEIYIDGVEYSTDAVFLCAKENGADKRAIKIMKQINDKKLNYSKNMSKEKYLKYVNVLIGTNNKKEFSHGNIYPLAQRPFGMVSMSVQTNNSIWYFNPNKKTFEGLRLTRIPSPWVGDYGQLLFKTFNGVSRLADTSDVIITPVKITARLSNSKFEVYPTESCLVFKIKYFDENRIFQIDAYNEKSIELTQSGQALYGKTNSADDIWGMGKRDFITQYLYVNSNNKYSTKKSQNGYTLCFEDDEIEVRVATSFISNEQALTNYNRELLNKSVEDIENESISIWEEKLGKIKTEADEDTLKLLYSCMYRAYLFPRRIHEIGDDKEAYHINYKDNSIAKGKMYVDNGFWDTYRTLFPLFSIIEEEYSDMMEGFYNFYLDTGWLPKWPSPNEIGIMPGLLIESVLTEAQVKGRMPKGLTNKVFEALIKIAETNTDNFRLGRKAVNDYRKLGYVPCDVHESVNETLDNVYGDYCISKYAESIGNLELKKIYEEYSKNYKNLFDSETGFMRAKDRDGNFTEGFNPISWGGDYTEGCAWQSTFAVMHDMKGLNELYNGKLLEKIDALFNEKQEFDVGWYKTEIHEMTEMAALKNCGQCAINNEPSFHIPYIYAEMGDKKKTASIVKNMIKDNFSWTENGFPGDDDNGSMASWVVFGLLGFYPFSPASGKYLLSYPILDSYKITTFDGRILNLSKKDFESNDKLHIEYSELLNNVIKQI